MYACVQLCGHLQHSRGFSSESYCVSPYAVLENTRCLVECMPVCNFVATYNTQEASAVTVPVCHPVLCLNTQEALLDACLCATLWLPATLKRPHQ